MTDEEYKKLMIQQIMQNRDGCSKPLLCSFMVVAIVCMFFCSCTTQRSTENSIEMHRMALLTQRMDSMLHATSTWQQTIYQQQTALVDSFKHSEVRDTSHTVFLGERGDTIKEKTIIYVERNTEHTTKESEKEYLEERLRQTDSLLQVCITQQEKNDSLLQSYQKTTMAEKQTPWYERLFNHLKFIFIGIAIGIVLILVNSVEKCCFHK